MKSKGKSILGGGLSRCKDPARKGRGTACRREEVWGGRWERRGVGRAGGGGVLQRVLAAAGPTGMAIRACQLPGLETMSETLKREHAASRIEKTKVKSKLIAVNLDTDRREQCMVLLTSQAQLKATLRGFCFKAEPRQDSCFRKDGADVLSWFPPTSSNAQGNTG